MVKGSSIKQGLLLTVILVTGIAIALSSTMNLWLQARNFEQSLIARTHANIDVLAVTLQPALAANNSAQASRILAGLQQTSFISHVHLYRYEPTTERVDFFTSYNRSDLPPIPARAASIEDYIEVRASSGSVELAKPIYTPEHQLLGYVYIRTSLNELNQYVWRSSLFAFVSFTLSLIVAGFLANQLRRHIMRPLREVNEVARIIHQQRNYSLRLPPAELLEIDHFSASMNSLLDKLQRVTRQLEEAKSQHHTVVEDLEAKIKQRTNALRTSNQELVSTLEQLHASQHRRLETERLAAMTDMVAGIAHEINTPIGLSVTAISLIEDKLSEIQEALTQGKTEKIQDTFEGFSNNVEIVQRNLQRAGELISNFRSLAFEHANEEPTAIHLDSFAHTIVEQLSPLLKNPERYQIEIDADDVMVEARRRPLESILTELLENAIYHGFKNLDTGRIEIVLRLHDEHLIVTCSDDGQGMSEEMQNRVFEPFMTSSRSHGHPGLGMHLVYNLVTQVLKGSIRCTSELGKGTTFTLQIPITSN